MTLTAAPNAPKAPPVSVTIVGVAPDVRQRASLLADPLVYLPFEASAPANAVVLVRLRDDGVSAEDLRAAALAADVSVPTYRIMTMAAAIDESEWGGRSSARLVSLVSLASILLAAIGLYAVTAYSVSERTQEIGLRMALGARTRQVSVPILARAGEQVGVSLALGILGAMAWDRLFASIDANGRGVADPWSLAIVAGILTLIAGAACMVPVYRATRLDPIKALRHE